MKYLRTDAALSDCGLYRYTLSRLWNPDRETVVFCMLNPSTADASEDDPTIRRCVEFADAWGYGRLVVVNLFALRATDPKELEKAADPVGAANDGHIYGACAGELVVCAWGANPAKSRRLAVRSRPVELLATLRQIAFPRHLGLTNGGHPKHPLYLPRTTLPATFPETP